MNKNSIPSIMRSSYENLQYGIENNMIKGTLLVMFTDDEHANMLALVVDGKINFVQTSSDIGDLSGAVSANDDDINSLFSADDDDINDIFKN